MKNMLNKGLAVALAAVVLVSGLVSVSFADAAIADEKGATSEATTTTTTVEIKTVETTGTYKLTQGWVLTTDNEKAAYSDEVSVGYIYLEAGEEFYNHDAALELVSIEDLGITGYVELTIDNTTATATDFA